MHPLKKIESLQRVVREFQSDYSRVKLKFRGVANWLC
jgi:hypothetical protein